MDLRVPVVPGALGDFQFEDRDYDWSDYRSQMYWAILRAWYNRLHAMLDIFDRWTVENRRDALKGTVIIRFIIERNGSVSSITILDPSTMKPLDNSAVGALKEVILPRLPDDFTKDREAVTGRFIIDVDDLVGFKMEMRGMKSRGIF